LQRKGGQLLVDLAQAFLLVFRQCGTAAHEAFVGLREQAHLLVIQSELFLLLIHGLHAGKQLGIQADVIRMGRKFRSHFLGNILQFRTGQ
jgi:hypothetical protein